MNKVRVEDHLGLARMVAHQFISSNQQLEYDDIFQVGCIGLVKAVNRFDPDRNLAFSTYAMYTIKGEVMRYLREEFHSLRVPRHENSLAKRILRDGMESYSVHEIAKALQCSRKQARTALELANTRMTSFDQTVVGDKSGVEYTLSDVIPWKDDYSQIEVMEILESLTDRERAIVKMRIEGKAQSDIGRRIGITQVQVSRLLNKIKIKIKKEGVAN